METVGAGYFEVLAEKLLQIVEAPELGDEFVARMSPLRGPIGFKYMRHYSGTMARPPRLGKKRTVRRKQGLFDIFAYAGDPDAKGMSHRQLFEALRQHSSVDAVLRVWRGEEPWVVGVSDEEKDLLTLVSLMMFEQEVNWGTEEFQRFTFFPPYQTAPAKRRPRDMLMGFIRQAFDVVDLNELCFWRGASGGETPTFKNAAIRFSDWPEYPEYLKTAYFDFSLSTATSAIMVDGTREQYRALSEKMPNNPHFQEAGSGELHGKTTDG